MNDPTYVEASRKLAERMLKEGGGDAGRADRVRVPAGDGPHAARRRSRRCLQRSSRPSRPGSGQGQDAAEKLLTVGESPRDEKLDPAELAAWAMVANAILNLDEVVTGTEGREG